MKILVIADVHGRSDWKEVVKQECDKIIFLGDYFDSFTIPFEKQFKNFQEIYDFKSTYPEKVTLLIGNHDFHYMVSGQRYSGYQDNYANKINEIISNAYNVGFLQLCCVENEILFSHAGVTKTWCKNNGIDENNIEEEINMLFENNSDSFKFQDFPNSDNSGDNIYQSPLWVRPKSLISDSVDWKQIVGHTQFKEITNIKNVYFVDVPGKSLLVDDEN